MEIRTLQLQCPLKPSALIDALHTADVQQMNSSL